MDLGRFAGPLVVVGLMSGTSADGIDVAVCRLSSAAHPAAVSCQHFATVPYPRGFKARLLRLSTAGTVADICTFNVLVGKLFAQAVHDTVKAAGHYRISER